jgi:hypothetical protein
MLLTPGSKNQPAAYNCPGKIINNKKKKKKGKQDHV